MTGSQMNRRTLILCLVAVFALLALVVASVTLLYRSPNGKAESVPEADAVSLSKSCPILSAIPTDAVMMLCCSGLEDCIGLLQDSSVVLSPFFYGTGKNGYAAASRKGLNAFLYGVSEKIDSGYVRSLKNAPAMISVHFSGDLQPLLVVDAGRAQADTSKDLRTILDLAGSMSVSATIYDGQTSRKRYLLVSPSLTLVESSVRHLSSGTSILDKEGCPEIVSKLKMERTIIVSNQYAGKLAAGFLKKPFSQHAASLKSFADWTGFDIVSADAKGIAMSGAEYSGNVEDLLSNHFMRFSSGQSRVKEILPAQTIFAASFSFDGFEKYSDSHKKFVDAKSQITAYKNQIASLSKSAGINPEKWAKALDIKEVAVASFVSDGDKMSSVVLVRPGNEVRDVIFKDAGIESPKHYDGSVLPYKYSSFAKALLWPLLDTPNDTLFVYKSGWIVSGDAVAMDAFGACDVSLEALLSDMGMTELLPKEGAAFTMYYALSLAANKNAEIFEPSFCKRISASLVPGMFQPVVLTVSSGASPKLAFRSPKAKRAKEKSSSAVLPSVKDIVVNIPQGPFKVRNCGTGRNNLFSQSDNLSLSLKEEDGKGIWSVPFSSRLCGAVENIDYYGNGKIQFLFASGTRLYLIDRLGRFVKPFPVDYGKEILLGPAAFDFTGAHGYTVLLVHTDNTVAMYDLKANKPASWQDIAPESTIKSLPELIKVGDKRYWIVRTATSAAIYGFNGGQPLTPVEGGKAIRPDSEITGKSANSVMATCLDGKQRNIKI